MPWRRPTCCLWSSLHSACQTPHLKPSLVCRGAARLWRWRDIHRSSQTDARDWQSESPSTAHTLVQTLQRPVNNISPLMLMQTNVLRATGCHEAPGYHWWPRCRLHGATKLQATTGDHAPGYRVQQSSRLPTILQAIGCDHTSHFRLPGVTTDMLHVTIPSYNVEDPLHAAWKYQTFPPVSCQSSR